MNKLRRFFKPENSGQIADSPNASESPRGRTKITDFPKRAERETAILDSGDERFRNGIHRCGQNPNPKGCGVRFGAAPRRGVGGWSSSLVVRGREGKVGERKGLGLAFGVDYSSSEKRTRKEEQKKVEETFIHSKKKRGKKKQAEEIVLSMINQYVYIYLDVWINR